MVTERQIQEMSERIVESFNPDRIVLFGSYAYGRPTPDSDVDLLIVMSYQGKAHHAAARIREVLRPDIPKEILVRSRQDLDERLSIGDCFIREVLDRGRVLYESTNTAMD